MERDIICPDGTEEGKLKSLYDFLRYRLKDEKIYVHRIDSCKDGIKFKNAPIRETHHHTYTTCGVKGLLFTQHYTTYAHYDVPFYMSDEMETYLRDLGFKKQGERKVFSAADIIDNINAYMKGESGTVFNLADFLNTYAKTADLDYKVKISAVDDEYYGISFYSENADKELAAKDLSVALSDLGILYTFAGKDEALVTKLDISEVFPFINGEKVLANTDKNDEKYDYKREISKITVSSALINRYLLEMGLNYTAKVTDWQEQGWKLSFFVKDGIKVNPNVPEYNDLKVALADLSVLADKDGNTIVPKYAVTDFYSYISDKIFGKEPDMANVYNLLKNFNDRLQLFDSSYKIYIGSEDKNTYFLSFFTKDGEKTVLPPTIQESSVFKDFGFDLLPVKDAVIPLSKGLIGDAYNHAEKSLFDEDNGKDVFDLVNLLNIQLKYMKNNSVLPEITSDKTFLPAKEPDIYASVVGADEDSCSLCFRQSDTGDITDLKSLDIFGIVFPHWKSNFIIPRKVVNDLAVYVEDKMGIKERTEGRNICHLLSLLKEKADLYKWSLESVKGNIYIGVKKPLPEKGQMADHGIIKTLGGLHIYDNYHNLKSYEQKVLDKNESRVNRAIVYIRDEDIEKACKEIEDGYFEKNDYYNAVRLALALKDNGMGNWCVGMADRINSGKSYCFVPCSNKDIQGLKVKRKLKKLGLNFDMDKEKNTVVWIDTETSKKAYELLSSGVLNKNKSENDTSRGILTKLLENVRQR